MLRKNDILNRLLKVELDYDRSIDRKTGGDEHTPPKFAFVPAALFEELLDFMKSVKNKDL